LAGDADLQELWGLTPDLQAWLQNAVRTLP
jgi:hypothetical protein